MNNTSISQSWRIHRLVVRKGEWAKVCILEGKRLVCELPDQTYCSEESKAEARRIANNAILIERAPLMQEMLIYLYHKLLSMLDENEGIYARSVIYLHPQVELDLTNMLRNVEEALGLLDKE